MKNILSVGFALSVALSGMLACAPGPKAVRAHMHHGSVIPVFFEQQKMELSNFDCARGGQTSKSDVPVPIGLKALGPIVASELQKEFPAQKFKWIEPLIIVQEIPFVRFEGFRPVRTTLKIQRADYSHVKNKLQAAVSVEGQYFCLEGRRKYRLWLSTELKFYEYMGPGRRGRGRKMKFLHSRVVSWSKQEIEHPMTTKIQELIKKFPPHKIATKLFADTPAGVKRAAADLKKP